MEKPRICPLANTEFVDPCPVRACPGNIAEYNPHQSCAYLLTDFDLATLEERIALLVDDFVDAKNRQLSALEPLLRDLKWTLEQPVANACSNCGYPTPCSSSTLCGDRKTAVESILVKLRARGEEKLRSAHLWKAVIAGKSSFLGRRICEELQPLITKKDLK